MDILIISPSLEPYGGVRVICNWAKHLAMRGHKTTIASVNGPPSKNWFDFELKVGHIFGWPKDGEAEKYDLCIATNPDTGNWLHVQKAKKKLYLCQMAEELFYLPDTSERYKALKAVNLPYPMVTVADWVKFRYNGRTEPIYVVQNGIDKEFFEEVENVKQGERTVLVEGWETNNEAKDIDKLTQKAIEQLKAEYPDLKVIGFGQQPLRSRKDLIDEYYQNATTRELVKLYHRSRFFMKASRYETRSLAPLEAIACGCIPIVACMQGHPDLIHNYNAYLSRYNLEEYLAAARIALNCPTPWDIVANGHLTATVRSWGVVIKQVEAIINAI